MTVKGTNRNTAIPKSPTTGRMLATAKITIKSKKLTLKLNIMNELYQGDNLTILREMPDASVDLICTDPPFNSGRDWGAFNDKWEGGIKGYLKFMEPRLEECRRVLKPTGSLYLHCDPTASHYLKVILDTIFGIKQFRNEIVWCYTRWTNQYSIWQSMHDAILYYTNSTDYVFNKQYQPYATKTPYTYVRKRVNGKSTPLRDENNKRIRVPKNTNGVPMRDVWLDMPALSSTHTDRTGYPTQKPIALYERMIKASSNQHDTVLDPFAGSGTTLDAAQSLGRHWIGIDSGETAIETIIDRLRHRHGLEYDRDYHITINNGGIDGIHSDNI